MQLNPAKCKTMMIDFLGYNSCLWHPICNGGVVVECVKSFKLLSIVISDDLTLGAYYNLEVYEIFGLWKSIT